MVFARFFLHDFATLPPLPTELLHSGVSATPRGSRPLHPGPVEVAEPPGNGGDYHLGDFGGLVATNLPKYIMS